ncbi:MAG: hypothetical protein RL199_816 [Pseudomonadota bacterium]|jgi:putative ABC transport system permease protein
MTGAPLLGDASLARRWKIMATTGWALMFHDRLKLLGTLLGVVFAIVLVNQQAGTFLGLLEKNRMLIKNIDADIWVTPPFTEQQIAGKPLEQSVLMRTRGAAGVTWAEPLVLGTASITLPAGGSEQVQLVGTHAPRFAGGPWNIVRGETSMLSEDDAVMLEDSDRDKFGGLNIGSLRELSGRQVRVAGFVWGLTPFGPSYGFAEIKLARDILKLSPDQQSFVLVRVAPGADHDEVAARLQALLPDAKVMTRDAYLSTIVRYILTKTPLGITFGTSAVFGLIIGFVTVALSMFSSVVDNIRQFGTLKAIGATTSDLAKLLLVQATTYALIGSTIGLFIVTRIADAARSPKLAIVLPPSLFAGSAAAMVVICVVASLMSLVRLRKIEPAMVFR